MLYALRVQVTTVYLHVGRVETCQMSSCIILHLLGIIIFKNFPNTIVIVFFAIYSVFSGGSLKLGQCLGLISFIIVHVRLIYS